MSNLTRWDPFHEMWNMRTTMDRFFDTSTMRSDARCDTTPWNLALDVVETDDEYVVKASLPGMNPDELDITYDSNLLTIKGEVQKEEEFEEGRYHLRERRYGAFSRSISLPTSVKAEKIEASYEAGILKLRLPKSEEAKPKRIKVRSASGAAKMIEGKAASVNKN